MPMARQTVMAQTMPELIIRLMAVNGVRRGGVDGSMRLAEALSINANPKKGGTETEGIVYLVFPGSVGAWKPPKLWWAMADVLSAEWGGLTRLKKLIPQLGREEGLLV